MWRNAGLIPKILGIDMRAYAGFALWLLYMSWWTFFLSLFLLAFFGALTFMKLPLPKLLGRVQTMLIGKTCHARPWNYHRYFVGTGKLRDLSS